MPKLRAQMALLGMFWLLVALCCGRIGLVQNLAITAVFGPGWRRWVDQFHAALKQRGSTHLKQGKSEMTFLSGYKTYIVAFAMLAFSLAKLLGVDLPAFDGQAPGSLFMEALAIIFLRQGVKTGGNG